eukprot:TRINITY_DN4362_c0_g1_i1.p1 TRINITY_DN4362_c0_g1~~TRINITY_DN4362_c0_g1_i1.p1  ORF type:complete len:655 (+),score=172.06 TRINITY_DN4362_c0_g1_i1:76-2040(+)
MRRITATRSLYKARRCYSTVSRSTKPPKYSSLQISSLHERYANGQLTVSSLVKDVQKRIQENGQDNVWIEHVRQEDLNDRVAQLQSFVDQEPGGMNAVLHRYPLFGVPFGVKDNIDVASYPSTSACPDYKYHANESSPAVDKCIAAGAIFMGKQNLDQFATGLVGVRSPYGIPRNAINADYIPGGSSSGSAVSVSAGLVSFALATDTAGSGRVPGSMNNVVGLKPTRGMISNTGMIPACRSLDCMAIYALTADDAFSVYSISKGYDERDEYSRREPPAFLQTGGHYYHNFGHILEERSLTDFKTIRFGVPDAKNLKFFGNTEGMEQVYREAVNKIAGIEGNIKPREINFEPWSRVASVLYDGPWISERLSAIDQFYASHPNSLYPTTKAIMERGKDFSAVDTFKSMRKLEGLRRETEKCWDDIDVLIVPTASTVPTVKEVLADPIRINTNLGYYTNFTNLLDLCGIQVPAGFLPNGMPLGITLIAPAFNDSLLYRIAQIFQAATHLPLGNTGHYIQDKVPIRQDASGPVVQLAVVGAHLSGMQLNSQLTDLGAVLLKTTRTASSYRLVDLDGKKPGLYRTPEGGSSVEVEVWGLPSDKMGRFIENVRSPLGIGNLELVDGTTVKGFVVEEYAAKQAKDITQYGGWRAYKTASKN